jgi:hypothetical protein
MVGAGTARHGQKIFATSPLTLQSDFARVVSVANLKENNMRSSIHKIMTASVILFFGWQTSLMAEDSATSAKAASQSTAQSTARAPAATIPPQPAWRGYYPHRPYYRPHRRRGSGSGFGFGSGSGPSFGTRSGPDWGRNDWGRDPFFDDPFMNDPFMEDPFFDDPWRRRGSGSGFGFGSDSGPSWGSGRGPRFYDRGRGPRDWDGGGMGFGW